MDDSLFWFVSAVIVAIATGAPMSNEEMLSSSGSSAGNEGMAIAVGKRAEEMVYYGNQQNEPRMPMKKSDNPVLHSMQQHQAAPDAAPADAPLGEVDQGGKIVAHEEIPVEEDLNARAEALKGDSEIDRLAEGMKVAEEEMEDAAAGAAEEDVEKDKTEEEGDEGEGVVNDDNNNNQNVVKVENDAELVNLRDENGNENDQSLTNMEMKQDEEEGNSNDDEDDNEDDELASLSNDANSNLSPEDEDDDNSTDEDVEEFLDELRQESEQDNQNSNENGDNKDIGVGDDRVISNNLKHYKAVPANNNEDPNYYSTLYHILANTYRGGPTDDYYENYNNMVVPSYYLRRRRSSSLRRRDLSSIRSRSRRGNAGHVRRIKRDLPSDWLAAYRGLDLPYSSNEIEDSLLSDPEESSLSSYTDEDEPISEELSRYIYANLLNKLYGGSLEPDVEEEIPYEEILPYEMGPEIPEQVLEEYEPEELLYDPDVPNYYRLNNPYEENPSYESYSKRNGAGFYPDYRRKRYFYPAYEEPETHWGAFVPEKRSSSSNYDEAIQRLQRLAFALSDNPGPYYESLLRGYKKK